MLSPPPRSQSMSSTNECGNTIVEKELPIMKTPDGEYACKDCVYVALPMPHASDLVGAPINPLAVDALAPAAHTPGVRVSQCFWDPQQQQQQRKKPKTSLYRNKSTYMSRTTTYDRFSRLLKMDQQVRGLWVSVGRSLQLLPLGPIKNDTLLRVLFAQAWPLCHVPGPGMELICGMSSGDVVWLDAISGKYTRINKTGNLTRAAVTAIAWYDLQTLQVVAGHADGSVVIYDLDREDGRELVPYGNSGQAALVQTFGGASPGLNPLAAFKLSNVAITELRVVENGKILSTSCDGYLRILNVEQQAVEHVLEANFGGLLTATLSHDRRYLAFGGEDDVIYLFEYATLRLLARLTGHTSWVRRVEFDPGATAGEYRLVSVGDDARLVLWEFSPESVSASGKTGSRVAQVLPFGEVRPSLAKVPQVPLTDIVIDEESIAAVGSDGRIWTFTRPGLAPQTQVPPQTVLPDA